MALTGFASCDTESRPDAEKIWPGNRTCIIKRQPNIPTNLTNGKLRSPTWRGESCKSREKG